MGGDTLVPMSRLSPDEIRFFKNEVYLIKRGILDLTDAGALCPDTPVLPPRERDRGFPLCDGAVSVWYSSYRRSRIPATDILLTFVRRFSHWLKSHSLH